MQRQILSKLFVKIVQKLDAIFGHFFGWSFLNLMLKPVSWGGRHSSVVSSAPTKHTIYAFFNY